MFCSVQQDKHTSNEHRSRCQIVAPFFFPEGVNQKNLHIKFRVVLFVLGHQQKLFALQALKKKAQCQDYIYTSEFTDYIAV